MESQFDRPVPARVGVEAEKWDLMKPGLSPEIVPLSVADMEFTSPPAIINALEDTARSPSLHTRPTGLWGEHRMRAVTSGRASFSARSSKSIS